MKRMKGWIRAIVTAVSVIFILLFSIIAPIDRTPLPKQPFHKEMQSQLDTVHFRLGEKGALLSAWRKISITPKYPMPMAGYRPRSRFESVHDSLFVRIIGMKANDRSYFLISADLLLFPPAVKDLLNKHFRQNPSAFLYFSATHTHNGVGGWHDSLIGSYALGAYNEQWVNETVKKIISAIGEMEMNFLPSHIGYWQADAYQYAENRLVAGAPYDGLLRGIELKRADSSRARLITFSAHPTSISKNSLALSGDYPAALIDTLEKNDQSFAMFIAGTVGSHRLSGIRETEFDMVASAGAALAKKVSATSPSQLKDSVRMAGVHIPIRFGPAQLRISHNWKIRNWVFSWLISPLQGELTWLQIDDIVFIGTPCDFSGEVFVNHISANAQSQNKNVIITSFNGDYAGYVTEDIHSETLRKEEVMTLNWVGPYSGTYFSEMINRLLLKSN
jgi:neutral ceramidase